MVTLMTNYANWRSRWSPRFRPIWAHWHSGGSPVEWDFSFFLFWLSCSPVKLVKHGGDCYTALKWMWKTVRPVHRLMLQMQRPSNAAFPMKTKYSPPAHSICSGPQTNVKMDGITEVLQQLLPFVKVKPRVTFQSCRAALVKTYLCRLSF